MKIDGYTRMAAVIAHPIRHSISPFIHNLAYELTATNAAYLAWDIAEEDLESTISQIRKLDMIGANISMPYKQKVFPYLDEVDEMALKIGSVNTIVHRNSKLKGYNTDGIGFFRSLPMTFSMKNGVMAILGAGVRLLRLWRMPLRKGQQRSICLSARKAMRLPNNAWTN